MPVPPVPPRGNERYAENVRQPGPHRVRHRQPENVQRGRDDPPAADTEKSAENAGGGPEADEKQHIDLTPGKRKMTSQKGHGKTFFQRPEHRRRPAEGRRQTWRAWSPGTSAAQRSARLAKGNPSCGRSRGRASGLRTVCGRGPPQVRSEAVFPRVRSRTTPMHNRATRRVRSRNRSPIAIA